MNTHAFIVCESLIKIYKNDELEVVALQGLDLEVFQGEIVALVGPSGSGKSTLLNILGGLDIPSAGTVSVGGQDLSRMNTGERELYKRKMVGFLWQQPSRNLFPYLSALENVELPLILNGEGKGARRKRARDLLRMVELEGRSNFRPDQLSGGQQQRIALAIALANNPSLLLADEPTGQIDLFSAIQVFRAIRRINRLFGTTVLIVTHDRSISDRVDRALTIGDGRISVEVSRRNDCLDHKKDEWTILDQAGRIQIPKPFLEKLAMKDRVKLNLESDYVTVYPGTPRIAGLPSISAGSIEGKPALRYLRRSRQKQSFHGLAVFTQDLCRSFIMGQEEIHALKQVNLSIPMGCLAVITGRSGSGKTTLLNLIAGLDTPSSGKVNLCGRWLDDLNAREKVNLRSREIGFVHQTIGLLPYLSVEENIEVPLRLQFTRRKVRKLLSAEALELVGLSARRKHRTYELSGGEQQRVAIARALVGRPSLILADEPTGQLDTKTGGQIITLIREIVRITGVTVLIASHDPNVSKEANLVYELRDGQMAASWSN